MSSHSLIIILTATFIELYEKKYMRNFTPLRREDSINMGSSNETQEKILNAAIKHFAQKGYHGAKTADIARDSGVAEGTVFKYYSTKKGILRAVLNKIIHETVPQIVMSLPSGVAEITSAAEPKAAAREFIKTVILKISNNVDSFKIIVNELQYHEDLKKEYLQQFVPRVIKNIEELFKIGVTKGIFKDINPHTAARSFMGMMAMIVLESNVLKSKLDLDQELDLIIDIYLNGVGAKKEG
ncbi:MAG: TetR/AcrR family transcriptional regulator [Caulobacteraceae bacterium]